MTMRLHRVLLLLPCLLLAGEALTEVRAASTASPSHRPTTLSPTKTPTFQPVAPSYCDILNPKVPSCEDPRPRDLLFLVDSSNSMQRDKFYTSMLDYTKALYCAFNPVAPNQAGMLTFAQDITLRIPLRNYTRSQWETEVEKVRNDSNACCTCCTPTAEAFDLANAEFQANGRNPERIAFVITDGVPYNNGKGGNPKWRYKNAKVGYSPAQYKYKDVPNEVNKLKASGVRVFLVGVPSDTGRPPDMLYFQGIPEPKAREKGNKNPNRQCVERENVNWCYNWKPAPIVSLPVNKNSFSSDTFDVQNLTISTVSSLCFVIPTTSPTPLPTTSGPTMAPTHAPTQAPTPAPVKPYVDQMDVTILLDRSNSMNWHDAACRKIVNEIKTPGDEVVSPSACWELFTNFASRAGSVIANITAGVHNDRALGWASQFPAPLPGVQAKGLRVTVLGFACRHNQHTPVVQTYAKQVTSEQALLDAMEIARTKILPSGGTCPGLAIEQTIRYIEDTDPDNYPFQTAIIVTDGVVYDAPHPHRATLGLKAYGVSRYSVGIAVPFDNNGYGLKPEEIVLQKQQLDDFAGDASRVFVLTKDGFDVLPSIADEVAKNLQQIASSSDLPQPVPRYTWCGWRREKACFNGPMRKQMCKWIDPSASQWACRPKKVVPSSG